MNTDPNVSTPKESGVYHYTYSNGFKCWLMFNGAHWVLPTGETMYPLPGDKYNAEKL